MARASYTKTTWVDRNATDPQNIIAGTKLNAANLNKLEKGLEDSDAAAVALEGRILAIETSGPVGEQAAEITKLITDLDADELLIGALRTELDAAKITIGTLVSDLDASELAVTALTQVVATLRADFNKHTHENVVGDVTGPVVLA